MAVSSSFKAQADFAQRTSTNKKKPTKFGGAFKKVGQYLQHQAQQQPHSALYLAPRDPAHQKGASVTEEELLQHFTADPHALPYGVIPPLSSNGDTQRSSTLTSMTTEYSADSGILQSMKRHQYASDNILQSYDVLIPDRQPSTTAQEDGYFFIFIHGGYFRDHKQTSKALNPTISLLESDSTDSHIRDKITGYASLNYRLAAHPGYPQGPSTPSYTLNNAYWPDQPNDILAALAHLQSHYPQSKRYILAGHSVGATMSLLAALRATDAGIIPPAHVLGICGIYDFPQIHKTNDDYESLTKNAMDPSNYKEASPALYSAKEYARKWTTSDKTRNILLAHSREDELVNWEQVEHMQRVFPANNDVRRDGFKVDLVEIKGTHYQVLDNGEVARSLGELLGEVSR